MLIFAGADLGLQLRLVRKPYAGNSLDQWTHGIGASSSGLYYVIIYVTRSSESRDCKCHVIDG